MADMGIGEYAAIASILGAGSQLVGAMKGGGGGATPPPIPAPTTMPTPDDSAAQAAKRQQLSALALRRGRQSTILSDPTSSDLLGG